MIPISTDAPIYHFPYATISLIVANCIAFTLTGMGNPELTEPWVLHFGTLNPLEWLSSMFAHANGGHILGNMMFLWAFGLIVEGKIGWLRMLGLYLGIGLSQAAFIQIIMLPWDSSGALGASSAIMGLMAISMIWAPKNELKLFYFFWFWFYVRAGTFEVTIMWYAIFYLGWDFLTFALFHGGGMGTPALHLSGALIGAIAGTVMLKKGWVDCEKWDLFRVMSGNYGRFADASTTVGSHANPELMFGKSDVAVKDELPDNSITTRHRKRLEKIVRMIKDGMFMEASEDLMLLRMEDSDAAVGEPMLKKLAVGLLKANAPDDAEIYLEEYIERFPDEGSWARVRLAHILLGIHKRPAAALAILKQVRLSQLAEEQKTTAKKIAMAAKKQVKAGVQDAEPEW